MRTTLIPALINNFLYNLARGTREISLYELSRVFINEGDRLPKEELRLSGIFFRENAPSVWQEQIPPFFVVKGTLQALLRRWRQDSIAWPRLVRLFCTREISGHHMRRTEDRLYWRNQPQYYWTVKPEDKETRDSHFWTFTWYPAYFGEGDSCIRADSKYPPVERDVALVVDVHMTSGEILELLRGYGSPVIESIELFDYYKGKNMPADKKALASELSTEAKTGPWPITRLSPSTVLLLNISSINSRWIKGISLILRWIDWR